MVSSSVIIITTNSECLTYGGFSLGETVSLGNFEFITDYIGVLSLSPRRGDAGVIRLNSQWGTYPSTGHDRGLHRGVPHDVKW
jgi:hypothetical protein